MSCEQTTPAPLSLTTLGESDLRAEVRLYAAAGAGGGHLVSMRVFLGQLELPLELAPVELPTAEAERIAWCIMEAMRVVARNEPKPKG